MWHKVGSFVIIVNTPEYTCHITLFIYRPDITHLIICVTNTFNSTFYHKTIRRYGHTVWQKGVDVSARIIWSDDYYDYCRWQASQGNIAYYMFNVRPHTVLPTDFLDVYVGDGSYWYCLGTSVQEKATQSVVFPIGN